MLGLKLLTTQLLAQSALAGDNGCAQAWDVDSVNYCADSGAPRSLLQKAAIASSGQLVSEVTAATLLHSDASHVSAVQTNVKSRFVTSNDFRSLAASTIIYSLLTMVHVLFFCFLRRRHPMLYSRATVTGAAPFDVGDGVFAWVSASMKLKPEDVLETAGLDAAMVLKFHEMCIKILLVLGVPIVLVLCPLHFVFGEEAEIDQLSKIDIKHVTHGSWLYWIHALFVWIVVVVVQAFMWQAQTEFLQLRYDWLRTMPQPRATTVFVQNIPREQCSDAKLRLYVNKMLMREAVQSAYVVRKIPEDFTKRLKELKKTEEKLREATHKWKREGQIMARRPTHRDPDTKDDVDSIEYYSMHIEALRALVRNRRTAIETARKAGDPAVFAKNGFVTFMYRHDRELALNMMVRGSPDEAIFSMPPDPSDVRYEILQRDSHSQRCETMLGILLVLVLFFSYLPLVIVTSLVTSLETLRHVIPFFDHVVIKYPVIRSCWDGMLGAIILTVIMSFVPTVLMLSIRYYFGMAAESWCQHRLQHWYYYFQILFVLLMFCIGNSLFSTYLKLVKNPTRMFSLLSSSLPQAAHFYLNFFTLQWATCAFELPRYFNLLYFHWYKRTADEDEAAELAEPEDQDYYGIGARTARFTLLLVIALVFCTVCPLITILAAVCFLICRLVYGYLLVFAETKKPDSGGEFWCTQLKHIQHGLFFYISLMVGILCDKSAAYGPGLLAALSYCFLIESYCKLDQKFRWARLPFEEIVETHSTSQAVEANESYMQLDLYEGESACRRANEFYVEPEATN